MKTVTIGETTIAIPHQTPASTVAARIKARPIARIRKPDTPRRPPRQRDHIASLIHYLRKATADRPSFLTWARQNGMFDA